MTDAEKKYNEQSEKQKGSPKYEFHFYDLKFHHIFNCRYSGKLRSISTVVYWSKLKTSITLFRWS